MANEFANSLLRIQNDTDIIDFIGGSTIKFRYLDRTLEIESPDKEDIKFSSSGYSGRALKEYVYTGRKISFDIHILGTDDNDVLTNTTRLRTLLSRISSSFYLAGGAYQHYVAYSSDSVPVADTGDSGVILSFRIGKDAGPSLTTEVGIVNATTHNALYTRVLRGELILSESKYTAARSILKDGVNYKYRQYTVSLECEPYLFMRPRQLINIGTPGLHSGLVSPSNSNINRIIIPLANIPGSEPALTRITTQINGGTGILIGRDAGVSMANCPAYPKMTVGSGLDDLYVNGDVRSSSGKIYKVKITGTGSPNQCQYSTNNGSSWSSNISITALQTYQLGSDDAYFYFENSTGHTLNNEWTFQSHQAVQSLGGTFDIYANRTNVYSENGYLLKNIVFNVPKGCHSRYKVYITYTTTGFTPEFGTKLYHGGYAASYSGKLYSGATQYDWILPPSSTVSTDLCVLDFTGNGTPGYMHPISSGEVRLDIYVRSYGTINNPASITLGEIYLIPCPDENSWFHAAWTDDGNQYEHFCNYDLQNPYMIETVAPSNNTYYRRIMPLNGSYGGDYITLIPGLDNTIVMIPIFSTETDWRKGFISNSSVSTGPVTISCKPRFLNL